MWSAATFQHNSKRDTLTYTNLILLQNSITKIIDGFMRFFCGTNNVMQISCNIAVKQPWLNIPESQIEGN